MAIATFDARTFRSLDELREFVQTEAAVITIYAIIETDGSWTIFYS